MGRLPLFFVTILRSAFYSCYGFLYVQIFPLRLACCYKQLSSLSGKRPGYYPPVWNTCLPADTVLPLWQVDSGIETERKG